MASGVASCCATPDCPSFDGELSDFVAFNRLNTTEKGWTNCADGLIVPVWGPTKDLTTLDRALRGAIYFAALSYLFIGVSIIADRFMAAIEVITSQEKEVRVKCSDGSRQIIVVRVWNETVANLTLMALGSSAPEIMLSVIEIYAKGFEAGDLGPGTIVGSAAFNLFVIIGVCILVVPDNEVRRIKHLRVFFITAAWSIFAYVWLYFILTWSSYGEVEVWEALLTFAFFFATVGTAYIADRRLLFCKYLAKDYRLNWRGIIVETEGEGKWQLPKGVKTDEFKWFQEEYEDSHVMREFEEHRQLFIKILKELRQKNRNLSVNALEAKAREEVLKRGPKSRAFYRMQATRKLIGGSNLTKKSFELLHEEDPSRRNSEKQEEACREFEQTLVHFNPGHYTVIENIGTFSVTVRRKGGDLGLTLMVDYQTEDGTAKAGQDYVHSQGTIVFPPGSDCQTFKVNIVDDDIFEEDEHFYIRLSNLRVKRPNGTVECAPSPSQVAAGQQFPAKLDAPALATVMILDNDHSGVFSLSEKDIEIGESVGECEVKVIRSEGARGRVAVPYRTISGTAKPGKDYEEVEGELIFENEETEKTIVVRILEEDSYEKNVLFYVEIDEPRQTESNKEPHLLEQIMEKSPDELTEEERLAVLEKPRLGENRLTQVRVRESKEFKNTVDKLLKRANASIVVGASTWMEQFKEALSVIGAPDDDMEEESSEDGQGRQPSCKDYILHILTVFWKVLFAFVPPTTYWNGWLCFSIAIVWIGILTAFIGDLASHFGCTIGLPDTVTAISFVALGTSIPDTFASKVAAIQDKYADASIGNVTGSNAVNVFLGIGIAWSCAAIYHTWNGGRFCVKPGNLAFSVTMFCSGAGVAILTLLLRRMKAVGGELGGPKRYKIPTAMLFMFLWLFYLFMSSMEAYGYIEGF